MHYPIGNYELDALDNVLAVPTGMACSMLFPSFYIAIYYYYIVISFICIHCVDGYCNMLAYCTTCTHTHHHG